MINIQKRYIYGAILAGISFVIFYLFLDLLFIISLGLSVLVYVAGIFLFKNKDLRVYDKQALAKYQFEMSKLNSYKEKIEDSDILLLIQKPIEDSDIKNKIENIVETCQKITKYLSSMPSNNVTKIYNSLDTYLDYSDKFVTKYIEASKKEEKSFTENQLMLKMKVYIKEVSQECDKLLKDIKNNKDKKLNMDMKIFEFVSDYEKGSEKNDK